MISVDVEAQPARASSKHIDRLIWGRFPNGRAGLEDMLAIADRHGVRLTLFLDYAEYHLYGEALLDVAREIYLRGHDLELHLHQQFLSDAFHRTNSIERVSDLNEVPPNAARAFADFLLDTQVAATGRLPVAFRGGGYRFNNELLKHLARNGVKLDSSFNPSRTTCPVDLAPRGQFAWAGGVTEIPISTISVGGRPNRLLDYNFNASDLTAAKPTDTVRKHLSYLDSFYGQFGNEAIAALVMHSWSFLELSSEGHYEFRGTDRLESFDALLRALSKAASVVTATDISDLIQSGVVAVPETLEFVRRPAARVPVAARANTHSADRADKIVAPGVPREARGMSTSAPLVAEAPTRPTGRFSVANCPVCGAVKAEINAAETCPRCRASARTRTLAPIIENVLRPNVAAEVLERPVLAFAMDGGERTLLRGFAAKIKSVSLYGDYGADHEDGVDARDLSRFDAGAFSGLYSIGLFDFFEEHRKALDEAYRVVAMGGFLATIIMPYRLLDSNQPPTLNYRIESRPDYFEYLPKGTTIPSIKVGRDWFVAELKRAGFEASRFVVRDENSGQEYDWFIGFKRGVGGAGSVQKPVLARSAAALHRPKDPSRGARVLSTPLDPATGFSRVVVTLTLPDLPAPAADCEFAAHPFSPTTGPSDRVYAVKKGGVAVSDDLGERWNFVPIPETSSVRLANAFQTQAGEVLLQGISAHHMNDLRGTPDSDAPLFVCDANLKVLSRLQPGKSNWHGPRSIDESGGVILYAEYPENGAKYRPDFRTNEAKYLPFCENSGVFRSSDGGRSWVKVFEKSWREIRHFHTVVADPYEHGVWYLSSGDSPNESRIWRSRDGGLSWDEITAAGPDIPLHPSISGHEQSINRHTDMVVLKDRLIWGTDDLLGAPRLYQDPAATLANRVGSRILISPKTSPLQPSVCGFVGSHIRSIVDVGPAYLVMTEAKHPQVTARPQVCLLTKEAPYMVVELFTVDRFDSLGTGFTYSRSSRAAKNGRFFTYRGSNDVFAGGPRILQWDVAFE